MKFTALIAALLLVGSANAQMPAGQMSSTTAAPTKVGSQPSAQEATSAVLKAQVLLDRAHFSVGEIDGVSGSNMTAAVKQFQQARNLPVTGQVDQATLAALEDGQPVFRTYTLTEKDVAGPFKGKTKYTNSMEKLGELFQSSPKLLKKLNPNAKFAAGETITVPLTNAKYAEPIAKIVVSKSDKSLKVYNAAGQMMGYYPTTLGSSEDVPYGEHKIVSITRNPYYNRTTGGKKISMGPGPNSLVGNIWMALSAKHYGIHGSQTPSKIAKQQSSGCVRLTNWDANEVGDAASKGTVVTIQE